MNEPNSIPIRDDTEQDTDLLVLLEDVLMHIDELHQQQADTIEVQPLLSYAASLRAKLP